MLKVIAFDLFGTVFDLSSVNRDEIRAYAAHIRKPDWSPLLLPLSWGNLPAFSDSAPGIAKLRKRFKVVTCSNAPINFQLALSKWNGVEFDAYVPMELHRVYKPNTRAYLTVCEVLGVESHEVAIVTANKDFGDLEASAALGMTPILIRGESEYPTITDLAERLQS